MTNEYATEIWPLAVYFGLVILLVITMLVLSWLLGQRRREAATNDPFESGVVPVGSSQIRISVEFYLIAIFFVIFDLETVFIFAWAVAFFELGWQGYTAMLVFIGVLVLALVYEWRSGALEWGNKTRVGLREAQAAEEKL
ncbi:MAG: NADH-quinone oxidoreductase subunit A [Porticoccaceae bacterium]|nr:NADH-quinone oxidoreductase subunit A [Porticoccaceae bacterium]